MLTASAARRLLPSPIGLPLAGFLRRAQRGHRCEAQDGLLEINAVAVRNGDRVAVLIALDSLIAGPDLTATADAAVRETFGPAAFALVAASHTHFAPATDRTRPMLGEVAPAYLESAQAALRRVVCDLRATQPRATLGLATRAAQGSINRRRFWPFPNLLWWVHRRIDPMLMAPNPKGPCDPLVRAAILSGEDGSPLAVIWNYACHPVFYPRETTATAEFPGYVRTAVRSHLRDSDLPVVFLQGFAGDICPDIRPERSLRNVAETLAFGPRWGRFTPESWGDWADGIAHAVLAGIQSAAPEPLQGPLKIESCSIPVDELVDGDLPQKTLRIDRLRIGNQWSMVAVSAEPSTAYAELLGLGDAWPVACTGDVYGYLPTEAQRRAGGYEVGGYFSALGLNARLRPGGEGRIVQAYRHAFPER